MRTAVKRVKAANMWCLSTWEDTKTGELQKQQWFAQEADARTAEAKCHEEK